MPDKTTYFVTGSAGFIGGRVVEALALTGAGRPRAGLRNWAHGARIARFPIEFALCDIMEPAQARRAVSGAGVVVHCAVGGPQIIVQGTTNLLEAAMREGVGRFVYLSSAEVYGNVSGEIDETAPRIPCGKPYADAKIKAEEVCRDYAQKGVPVVVLRPSIVYGPYSRAWTVKYAQRLQSGKWGELRRYGDGFCNLVYVDDLVTAILRASVCDEAVGEAFNVNGPDQVTWNEYFVRFNRALRLPEISEISAVRNAARAKAVDAKASAIRLTLRFFARPIRQLSAGNARAGEVMRGIKRSMTMTPNSAELGLFSRRAVYVTGKAGRLLGFTPSFDLELGLRLSVRWLEHNGFVAGFNGH